MQLWFAAALAAITLIGAISCLKSKRLKNTGRGMLLFGIVLALYCILTLFTQHS